MNLLAIETSCDETAISIINFDKNQNAESEVKFTVLSNHVLSQINIHREFGGVFPTLAKREHAKNIIKIFVECLKEANLYKENTNIKKEIEEINTEFANDPERLFEEKKKRFNYEKVEKIRELLEREPEMFSELMKSLLAIEKPDINAIAVTMGPGLAPALWVGINFAKAISILWDIEVYPINHMEGHIVSALVSPIADKEYILKTFESPSIALLISGGHTEIISFSKFGKYQKIGKTLDDAVGEAFDKVARSLNLPYPGGPEISKIAEAGRINGFKIENNFKLPRPMINSHDLNFSFSGLKTAVIYKIKEMENAGKSKEEIKNIISLDFENAVTEVLLKKVKDAVEKVNAKSLLIGGGVIANTHIRNSFTKFADNEGVNLYIPERFLTGDNAFMIGTAAILQILKGKESVNIRDIKADSNFSVESI